MQYRLDSYTPILGIDPSLMGVTSHYCSDSDWTVVVTVIKEDTHRGPEAFSATRMSSSGIKPIVTGFPCIVVVLKDLMSQFVKSKYM